MSTTRFGLLSFPVAIVSNIHSNPAETEEILPIVDDYYCPAQILAKYPTK